MFLAVSRVKKLRGESVHNYGIYTLSTWLVKNPVEQIYASIRMPVNSFFFSLSIWLIFLEFVLLIFFDQDYHSNFDIWEVWLFTTC